MFKLLLKKFVQTYAHANDEQTHISEATAQLPHFYAHANDEQPPPSLSKRQTLWLIARPQTEMKGKICILLQNKDNSPKLQAR